MSIGRAPPQALPGDARAGRDLRTRHQLAWLLTPIAIGLASRLVVILVGFTSQCVVPNNPLGSGPDYCYIFPGTRRAVLESWYSWDAGWYLSIASRGYSISGPDAPSVAFWPLLPALEWLVGWPARFTSEPILWLQLAGMLVTLAAFLTGLAVFYRLMRTRAERDVARRATTFLAFAPGAIFYTAPYPEGLLLAGVSGCLLALHRRRWLLAGLAGAAAALAQKPGVLLVIPFIWGYLAAERRLGWSIGWLLLIPLAPALWLAGLAWSMGMSSPLAPVDAARQFWGHAFSWPWETAWAALSLGVQGPAENSLVWLNLAMTLAALVTSGLALWRGPRTWGLWGLAVLCLYLSLPAEEPLKSLLRYALPLPALWLATARWCRGPLAESLLIGGLAAFQALLTVLFVHGYWVA